MGTISVKSFLHGYLKVSLHSIIYPDVPIIDDLSIFAKVHGTSRIFCTYAHIHVGKIAGQLWSKIAVIEIHTRFL